MDAGWLLGLSWCLAWAVTAVGLYLHTILADRFRRVLVKRHPDVWTEIARKNMFFDAAVQSYISSREFKELADPELVRLANRIRSWGTIAGGLYYLFLIGPFLVALAVAST